MSKYTALLNHFKGNKLVVTIVLDGYGIGKQDYTDAVATAKTPFFDSLKEKYATTQLATHGFYVGLPQKKDLGGSEVGHLTLGAGRIIDQGATMVSKQIKSGEFEKQPVLQQIYAQAKDKALHVLGLLSDGNVHSHIDHIIAIVKAAAKYGVKKCYIHALLDGRDVAIQSADSYITQLDTVLSEINKQNSEYSYAFASLGGRETITMDRDKNWNKIEKGWKAHVEGNSGHVFSSALEGLMHFRKENPKLIDQDCTPYNVADKEGNTIQIKDGDAVIFANFRADRATEITEAFVNPNFNEFPKENSPKVLFASMMKYDADINLPELCLVESPIVKGSFGERLVNMGKKQFRLAETQKYAHVTFFFNGGYRTPLDDSLEDYILIPSDKIDSFANAPQMKAMEIAEKACELIGSKNYEYGLINIANPDMVGHTGDFKATVQAVETVDKALQQICEAIEKVGGLAIITADHGNADEMLIMNKNNQEEPATKHSINPVPCVLFDPNYKQQYSLMEMHGDKLPSLSQIVATNYILMGIEPPSEYDEPLFKI